MRVASVTTCGGLFVYKNKFMEKIKVFLKQNWGKVVFLIITVGMYVRSEDIFFLIILAYGIVIYLLQRVPMSEKAIEYLLLAIFVISIILMGLTFYVNYYLPHGPSYPTGDYVCQFDGRGQCTEEYKEDLSQINISYWAKLTREYWLGVLFGLIFIGVVIDSKKDRVSAG